ncbi:hypothetical protein F5B22DRAFT_604750 [Xylaria bambusicola]|uniref:uncharacterized protein n=1 Tax=Xylaria bambusicola TaxID=326684 RepID=UPI002008CFF8|nr:uncharacterized protein F5B22DRAFT_604750 [Xylaria bambusicola]KAI0517098.1 hypothetical protein F5B22DRAFT_604750 [Xylaria bambusicola]
MEVDGHIWLVRLGEGRSIVETVFLYSQSGNLENAAIHATRHGEHYALFQCDDDPAFLAIIGFRAGNRDEAAAKSMERRLSLIQEFVNHQELFLLNVEVSQVALASDKCAILFSESQPIDVDSLPGKGSWAASIPLSSLLVKGQNGAASETSERTWIQAAVSDDADRLSQAGSIKRFTKFMENRVASQSAE